MNAIEFTAIAHDGIIDLPEPYRAEWNRKIIRVICLEPDAGAIPTMPTETTPDTSLPPRRAGELKGRIKIAPDFNAPLEDFAEYEE